MTQTPPKPPAKALRNTISAVLLVVALVGIALQFREARLGIPGHHHLILTAYIMIALYAGFSIFLRSRA